LFVLPFIAELLIARRWRRAAFFILAYLLIGLFWASYWQIALSVSGIAVLQAAADTPLLLQRMLLIFSTNDITAVPLMMLNLLRFAAWQHILLVPLLVLAWPSVRRGEGIARPLAAGMLLMIGIVLILLPWQGVGWGYRYLHGLLGNACLLGCYGWMRGARAVDPERRRALIAATSAFTLFVILPFLLFQTDRFVRPHREASAFLENSGADIIIVDPSYLLMGHEFARNLPDLSNRPLLIDLSVLKPEQVEAMCKRRRFALLDERHGRVFGLNRGGPPFPLRNRLHELGCVVPLPVPGPTP
jgi:hypothetical protein